MANFGAYLDQKYNPPFEDWWSIKAIDTTLKELSAELLGLPGPLPPRLTQLSRILDKAIIERASYWESGSAEANNRRHPQPVIFDMSEPGEKADVQPNPIPRRDCPDGGRCHHFCAPGPCFRVLHCGPLSDAGYPDDKWPASIREKEQAKGESRGVL